MTTTQFRCYMIGFVAGAACVHCGRLAPAPGFLLAALIGLLSVHAANRAARRKEP